MRASASTKALPSLLRAHCQGCGGRIAQRRTTNLDETSVVRLCRLANALMGGVALALVAERAHFVLVECAAPLLQVGAEIATTNVLELQTLAGNVQLEHLVAVNAQGGAVVGGGQRGVGDGRNVGVARCSGRVERPVVGCCEEVAALHALGLATLAHVHKDVVVGCDAHRQLVAGEERGVAGALLVLLLMERGGRLRDLEIQRGRQWQGGIVGAADTQLGQEQHAPLPVAGLIELKVDGKQNEIKQAHCLHLQKYTDEELKLCDKFYYAYRNWKKCVERNQPTAEIKRLKDEIAFLKAEYKAVAGSGVSGESVV